jgi:hypothetical protein
MDYNFQENQNADDAERTDYKDKVSIQENFQLNLLQILSAIIRRDPRHPRSNTLCKQN